MSTVARSQGEACPPPPPAMYSGYAAEAHVTPAHSPAPGVSSYPPPGSGEPSATQPPPPAQVYWPYPHYPGAPQGAGQDGLPPAAAGAGSHQYSAAPGYWGPPAGYPVPPGAPQGAPGYAYPYVTAPPLHGSDTVHIGIPVDGTAMALKPAGTRVDIIREEGTSTLKVVIPAIGLRAVAANLIFIALWLGMVALGLVMMILFSGPFFLIAFSIPFLVLGIWYLLDALRTGALKETIVIADGQYTMIKDTCGWKSTSKGSCSYLQSLELRIKRRGDRVELEPDSWCVLIGGPKELAFGRFIKLPEQQWVLAELSMFLRIPIRHVAINNF